MIYECGKLGRHGDLKTNRQTYFSMEYSGKLFGKVGKRYFPLLDTTDDVDNLKKLLRETVMRAHFALPENDEDAKWFDDPGPAPDFMHKIFDVLELGKHGLDVNEHLF